VSDEKAPASETNGADRPSPAPGAPPPVPPTEGAREARARLIAAPIILLVVGAVLWIQHATGSAIGTTFLLAFFAGMAGAEMALLLRATGRASSPQAAGVGCGLLCLAGLGWEFDIPPADLRGLVFIALVAHLLVRHLTDTRPGAVGSLATRFVPLLVIGFPLSYMTSFVEAGALVVMWFVLVVKASDMAGWAVGVPFGRHKMIPTVSPGKSWEGTIAGLAASALASLLLAPLAFGIGFGSRAGFLVLFGLVAAAAATLSGVFWSGWKRRLGAKDSSGLLPAMGGVADMMDSFILAAPVGHLLLTLLW
jgi:phosphatidate cytidylyltransferase